MKQAIAFIILVVLGLPSAAFYVAVLRFMMTNPAIDLIAAAIVILGVHIVGLETVVRKLAHWSRNSSMGKET